jgi:hypothetical protein
MLLKPLPQLQKKNLRKKPVVSKVSVLSSDK